MPPHAYTYGIPYSLFFPFFFFFLVGRGTGHQRGPAAATLPASSSLRHCLPRNHAPHAFTYGIPYSLYQELGIRRYGFHGTSYAYLLQEAARFLNKPEKDVNMIAFHLGAGASVAAVKQVRPPPTFPLVRQWCTLVLALTLLPLSNGSGHLLPAFSLCVSGMPAGHQGASVAAVKQVRSPLASPLVGFGTVMVHRCFSMSRVFTIVPTWVSDGTPSGH